jgi:NTE family protein
MQKLVGRARSAVWCTAILLLAGCAPHFQNVRLDAGRANEERRSLNLSDPNRPLILMAFSGGGSRAAALSLTVLRELRDAHYVDQSGHVRRLVDDVAIVSSVSGGSVTAAYFGLYGPDRLDEFDKAFLQSDTMRELFLDAANPVTWGRLTFERYTQSDVLEDLFDAHLFSGRTFSELNQPGKPIIVLNATDMVSGEVFSFTPARFDDICSDLDRERIAVGVTASAAVPVLLSPVSLQNYSTEPCPGVPTPPWIKAALTNRFSRYLNVEGFKRARYANDLRHGEPHFRDIRYVYLLDGGLADNVGLRS